MRIFWLGFVILFGLFGCTPKEKIVLRAIENMEFTPAEGGDPVLKATARFYNPNNLRMKLKEVQVDIFIDGKKSAQINQHLNSVIKSKSEFTVPLEVQLALKEIGLLDSLLGLLGGRKYEIRYLGYIRVTVRGAPVKIPIDYSRPIKLRF